MELQVLLCMHPYSTAFYYFFLRRQYDGCLLGLGLVALKAKDLINEWHNIKLHDQNYYIIKTSNLAASYVAIAIVYMKRIFHTKMQLKGYSSH